MGSLGEEVEETWIPANFRQTHSDRRQRWAVTKVCVVLSHHNLFRMMSKNSQCYGWIVTTQLLHFSSCHKLYKWLLSCTELVHTRRLFVQIVFELSYSRLSIFLHFALNILWFTSWCPFSNLSKLFNVYADELDVKRLN